MLNRGIMQNELLNKTMEELIEAYTIEAVCDALTEVCLEKADLIAKGTAPEQPQTARYWVKFARRFTGQR